MLNLGNPKEAERKDQATKSRVYQIQRKNKLKTNKDGVVLDNGL